jgi:uncharacterized protein YbaR (Trm112 family)
VKRIYGYDHPLTFTNNLNMNAQIAKLEDQLKKAQNQKNHFMKLYFTLFENIGQVVQHHVHAHPDADVEEVGHHDDDDAVVEALTPQVKLDKLSDKYVLEHTVGIDFLKTQYMEVLNKLAQLVECPVCKEELAVKDLSLNFCGHLLCHGCKAELGKVEDAKCPLCNAKLWFKAEEHQHEDANSLLNSSSVKATKSKSVYLLPYTEYSIVLVGSHFEHKESAKQLGAKWCSNLQNPVEGYTKGWIFKKAEKEQVEAGLKAIYGALLLTEPKPKIPIQLKAPVQ